MAGALCPSCRVDLPWHDAPRCPTCALPTHDGLICGRCLREPPAFDRTVATFRYAFPVDALIQALKYGQRLGFATTLSALMLERAAGAPRPDLLIAMPLHSQRLRERGFNQALELARILAQRLDVPVLPDGARRIVATPPQVGQPWKERARNLRGAFSCELDLSGKHVAVVDDVMTTGASLNELAKALRRCGAREISAWVAARATGEKM